MNKKINSRKEVKKMALKSEEIIISDSLMKKINSDIKAAQSARKNGDMGTPVEEVILQMKKIIEGEHKC